MRIFFWTILLFLMWLILTANFQIANLLIGLGISFVLAFLYEKMFTHEKIQMINPYYFGVYLFILMKNIIISNLQIAKRTLSKDMKLAPAIVGVKTQLTSDWKKLLLANSITLTPGTLTLDVKDDMLYIHIIEYRDEEDKAEITREFENIIAKI